MTSVHVLACSILINFENTVFVSRLLDFSRAVGYEQVDLDTCLLSERPKLAPHGVDSELPPEPQPLPSPVRGAFLSCISQVQSGQRAHSLEESKMGPPLMGLGQLNEHAGAVTRREEVVAPECGSRGC